MHEHHAMEPAFAKSKHSQINKWESLQSKLQQKDKLNQDPDLSETLLKRWVKVLSQYKPMPAEISVLGKGLNFTIAQTRIPAKEIVKVTEVACQRLDGELADLLRNEVVGIMQNAKHHKSNLTKAERDDLKTLKSNTDIVILPADKGKAVVVMDSKEYTAQCETLLGD